MPFPILGGNRWHPPRLVEGLWEKARGALVSSLHSLSDLLDHLQMAASLQNIEQLPDKALCTANTALTATGVTDITGAILTLTPDVDLHVLVLGSLNASCTLFGAATHTLTGLLYVNGSEVATAERMVTTASALNDRRHMAQSWAVSLSSGKSYEFKLRADISNAGTQWSVLATHTGLAFLLMPNRYNPGQPIG